jgi:hypothetical protein
MRGAGAVAAARRGARRRRNGANSIVKALSLNVANVDFIAASTPSVTAVGACLQYRTRAAGEKLYIVLNGARSIFRPASAEQSRSPSLYSLQLLCHSSEGKQRAIIADCKMRDGT